MLILLLMQLVLMFLFKFDVKIDTEVVGVVDQIIHVFKNNAAAAQMSVFEIIYTVFYHN